MKKCIKIDKKTAKKDFYANECDFLRLWLKEKRLEANLSQEQFSLKLNIHRTILAKIETGIRTVGAIELFKFCQTLNIDPCEPMEYLKFMSKESETDS